MTLNAIVVVDQNWAIGLEGEQLIYLPQDLKRFQGLTTGKAVVLGRKTLATFPKASPLKNRKNYILSRDPSFSVEGGIVCSSVSDFLRQAQNEEEVFLIGGASLYEELLPQCKQVYVTKIFHAFERADCYFPNLDTLSHWKPLSPSDSIVEKGVSYHYITYEHH